MPRSERGGLQGDCVECIAGVTECPGSTDVCDGFFYCVPAMCAMDQKCGVGCAPCPPAQGPCAGPEDCIEKVCVGGSCAIPSCQDGVQNDGEPGVDCGAPSCANKCVDGQGCKLSEDCVSGVCWGGVCQTPSCIDGVQNADESGPDCGGACPLPCKPAL